MGDLVTVLAVVGCAQISMGTVHVKIEPWQTHCAVTCIYPKAISYAEYMPDFDATGCAVFEVRLHGCGDADFKDAMVARDIFDRTLAAVSESIIWQKAQDLVGILTAYARQVGITDVKAFFSLGVKGELLAWRNPSTSGSREVMSMIGGFMAGLTMTPNGAEPLHPIARRVLSVMDLVNLGFYTDAFVSMFALLDDLVQSVVMAGIEIRGLTPKAQEALMRSVKEERFKVYVCHLTKLCGWVSLAESDAALMAEVEQTNTVRNKIMHGSRRLDRLETLKRLNILLRLMDWLRVNPFGYHIPEMPLLKTADPTFHRLPKLTA